MRRKAVERLVREHLDELAEHAAQMDPQDCQDIREVLLRECDEEPDGAFGAWCHHLDPDQEASREDVAATLRQVLASITEATADQVARAEAGCHILAAITRDGTY